ncbi:hypothetical protein [Kitasatospora sp. NPDC001547]
MSVGDLCHSGPAALSGENDDSWSVTLHVGDMTDWTARPITVTSRP